MANKRLFQFLYTKQPKLSMITGGFTAGANGTVASGSAYGAGVYQIRGFGSGNYQIKLSDNWVDYLAADINIIGGISAAAVGVADLAGSSSYIITTVGNSTWTTVGLDSDYTAAVGQPFVATAVAGSGTGVAKLVVPSGITHAEVMPQPDALLNNIAAVSTPPRGSSVLFKTLAPSSAMISSAAVTTMVATNPVGSSQITFSIWFKDSGVTAL